MKSSELGLCEMKNIAPPSSSGVSIASSGKGGSSFSAGTSGAWKVCPAYRCSTRGDRLKKTGPAFGAAAGASVRPSTVDAHLGVADQQRLRAPDGESRDDPAVDDDAVRRAQVDDLDAVRRLEAHVPLRHQRVVQHDVALLVAPEHGRAAPQRELSSGIRPAHDREGRDDRRLRQIVGSVIDAGVGETHRRAAADPGLADRRVRGQYERLRLTGECSAQGERAGRR